MRQRLGSFIGLVATILVDPPMIITVSETSLKPAFPATDLTTLPSNLTTLRGNLITLPDNLSLKGYDLSKG